MNYPASTMFDDIDLNAQGILRLQENNTSAAVRCFSDSLRHVTASIRRYAAEQQQSTANNEEGDNIRTDSLIVKGALVGVELLQRKEIGASEDTDCTFAIFNRALHMSLDSLDDINNDDLEDGSSLPSNNVPETFYHLLCAVLLYNIGLAHHLVALEMGNSKMLTKALDFYSMSHRTVPRDDELLRKPSDFALLALANNVGHIHFCHCNHDKSKICANEILERLSFLTLSPTSSVADCTNEEKEQQLFLFNASFFAVAGLMPAPAA